MPKTPPLDQSVVELGARIREARRRQGMTMSELAEAVSRDDNSVWRWEKGLMRVSADNFVKLARTLDVSVGWLAGEEGGSYERDRLTRRIAELPEKYRHMVERVVEELVEGIESPEEQQADNPTSGTPR